MAQKSRQQMKAPDEAQRRAEDQMLRERMGEIGLKLLVLSGKGGVGKSTVAANLAVSLARRGKVVGLLDVDVHGPSIPKLMGLEGNRPGLGGSQMSPVQVGENLKVMSIGFLLDSRSEAVIWRGPLKYNVIRQFLKDVAWGRLDYLVVDSPPGTGDEPLSVAQLVGSPNGAVVVTTPQDLAISDVRRCISFCNALSLPVVGIIENMSGYVCPNCGQKLDLFKKGGGELLAREMNVPFLGRIPIDPQITVCGDAGAPFSGQDSDSPSSEAFESIVDAIIGGHAGRHVEPETDSNSKETHSMKIAIPLAAGRFSMHFGHCDQFAILEVDEQNKTVTNTTLHEAPAHEPGALPRWLHEQGANVIIAGGMGRRAQQLFAENGITVVVGAPGDTPEAIAEAYLAGTLQAGENICDH